MAGRCPAIATLYGSRLRSGVEIVAVCVHHFGPRGREVLRELLLRVRAAIDLRDRSELRVRAEDQIDARAGPLQLIRLAVAALVDVATRVAPLRAHVQKVEEEVVAQRAGLAGEDPVFRPPDICA